MLPPSLALYMLLARRGEGVARRKLLARLAEGKEDKARLEERFGHPSLPRPEGPLVWFHAASVGESLALVELMRLMRFERPGLNLLVTSGTVSSARILAKRLPEGAVHQFVPVDLLGPVRRFLDHWQPDLALWTESEFWPALMLETHARGIPMLLVNARISARSARRWRRLKGAARRIVNLFDHVLAQDEDSARRLLGLGLAPDKIEVTGSLKEGAPALPCDESERQRLVAALAGRPLWLAASTHAGEEEIVLEAHRIVRQTLPGLLLILAPRHPERGPDLAEMIRAAGCSVRRRTQGALPEPDTDVYLADTLGEMGLWYRLAPVSFIGGSLVEKGGHNPFEPAALGSAILHGPHVENFKDIYARLLERGGSRQVQDAASLARAVQETIQPDVAAAMATQAWDVSSEGAEVTDRVLHLLLDALDRSLGRALPAPNAPCEDAGDAA